MRCLRTWRRCRLSIDALDQLLGRLDEPPPPPPAIVNPDLPAPLNRVPLGRWWPVGVGTRFRPIAASGGATAFGGAWGGLLLAQPGRSLPRHGHKGLELTCILAGSFADGAGQYVAGDLSEPVTDHDQPPVVVGAQPCLCVIASEGMRLRGLLGLGAAHDRPIGTGPPALPSVSFRSIGSLRPMAGSSGRIEQDGS